MNEVAEWEGKGGRECFFYVWMKGRDVDLNEEGGGEKAESRCPDGREGPRGVMVDGVEKSGEASGDAAEGCISVSLYRWDA